MLSILCGKSLFCCHYPVHRFVNNYTIHAEYLSESTGQKNVAGYADLSESTGQKT